jgi:hypothetical protein
VPLNPEIQSESVLGSRTPAPSLPPPVWDLRWALASVAVYTHLREEDGVGMADITVASLAIVEDQLNRRALPSAGPAPPVRSVGGSRIPGDSDVICRRRGAKVGA